MKCALTGHTEHKGGVLSYCTITIPRIR